MKVIEANNLIWDFAGEYPKIYTGRTSTPVDPFPAYAHDKELVEFWAAKVFNSLPIKVPPTIYLLSHEARSRTNGWAQRWWNNDPTIVMSAKRVPIHPAMTRYLVAHEYGHHVDYALGDIRGYDENSDGMRLEYQAIRGGELDYSGGIWHKNVGELFANDFRILVAGVEAEFWPHPGFPHPLEAPPRLRKWWDKTIEQMKEAQQ